MSELHILNISSPLLGHGSPKHIPWKHLHCVTVQTQVSAQMPGVTPSPSPASLWGAAQQEPVFWEWVPFVGACPELSHTFPITEQLPDWYSPAPLPCTAHVPPLISPGAGAADTKSLKMAAETAIWGWSDSQGWREGTAHPTLHSLDTKISLWDS